MENVMENIEGLIKDMKGYYKRDKDVIAFHEIKKIIQNFDFDPESKNAKFLKGALRGDGSSQYIYEYIYKNITNCKRFANIDIAIAPIAMYKGLCLGEGVIYYRDKKLITDNYSSLTKAIIVSKLSGFYIAQLYSEKIIIIYDSFCEDSRTIYIKPSRLAKSSRYVSWSFSRVGSGGFSSCSWARPESIDFSVFADLLFATEDVSSYQKIIQENESKISDLKKEIENKVLEIDKLSKIIQENESKISDLKKEIENRSFDLDKFIGYKYKYIFPRGGVIKNYKQLKESIKKMYSQYEEYKNL